MTSTDTGGIQVAVDLTTAGFVFNAAFGHLPFALIELTNASDERLDFKATIGGGFETDLAQAADVLELFTEVLRRSGSQPPTTNAETPEREYIVVVPHIVGNVHEHSTEYSVLRRHRRWPTRDKAVQEGIWELDHDDFLLAIVEGDEVVGVAWQNEDRGTDPEDLAERAAIAQALGLRARIPELDDDAHADCTDPLCDHEL
jgi:hypothetical protein